MQEVLVRMQGTLENLKNELVGMRFDNQEEYHDVTKSIIEGCGLVYNYTDYDVERIYDKEGNYLAYIVLSEVNNIIVIENMWW